VGSSKPQEKYVGSERPKGVVRVSGLKRARRKVEEGRERDVPLIGKLGSTEGQGEVSESLGGYSSGLVGG